MSKTSAEKFAPTFNDLGSRTEKSPSLPGSSEKTRAAKKRQHPERHTSKKGAKPQVTTPAPKNNGSADQREALFNARATGTFRDVMVREYEVTSIHGILLEIDGECLRIGKIIDAMPADGFELYKRHVKSWLDNHPVLRKAEVRFSGRWIHCILWFDTPVEIKSDRQRELWKAVIEAVQRSLPTDPEAPSLLAMTRPIGSVNSKTGRPVKLIKAGEAVTEAELLNFADDLARRGFATITQILFGSVSVSPCPFCLEEGSTLQAVSSRYRTTDPSISNRGSCYHCGKLSLGFVMDAVLKGRDKPEKAGGTAAQEPAPAPTSATQDDSEELDVPFNIKAEGQGG
jgi:hypothetical protein